MIPRSPLGRFAFAIWALASAGLLAFAYVQRAIHDMPIALTWLLLTLDFPSSIFAAQIVAAIPGSSPSGTFTPAAGLWFVFTLLGYVQWFVLLPWLWHRMRSGRSQMRLAVLVSVFLGSAVWGFNDLAAGLMSPFLVRIVACVGIASLALWWAAKPSSPQAPSSDNDA